MASHETMDRERKIIFWVIPKSVFLYNANHQDVEIKKKNSTNAN